MALPTMIQCQCVVVIQTGVDKALPTMILCRCVVIIQPGVVLQDMALPTTIQCRCLVVIQPGGDSNIFMLTQDKHVPELVEQCQ